MCLHGDHAGEDSKEGAGQVKKVIRWPAKFQRLVRGSYEMVATVDGEPVSVGLAKLSRDRWAFNVVGGSLGEHSFLYGYAHTMAAAKRCAHRDMMFLLKRAGVKGVF